MEKIYKFAMVTTFYPPYSFGGDALFVYWLSNELARRGHQVDVYHCEDAFRLLQKGEIKNDFPNHTNIKVVRLKSRAGFLSPLLTQQTGIPFFKTKLKNFLENEMYDVIHYHNISLIGISALSYGSACVKLYTMHEHWLVCPMHVLWKFDREVCTKKECFSCQIAGQRPPQLWRYTGLLEKMLEHIDCFISPSQFTLKKHLELGLDIPIKHIPNFIPSTPKISENSENKKVYDQPYFLFVGRLEKIKGLQNIIPIFKTLRQYDLLIAGDGGYQEELKKIVGESANIKFLGKLNRNFLNQIYRDAIAVIIPSVCYETFGIISIEAFAMKTPVIVNNLGALPEIVEVSGGGFTYNNSDELIEAMKKIAENPALRAELRIKANSAFLKYWNTDAHLKQYFKLIETIQNNSEKSKKDKVSDTLF